jgi:hypothetical protein
MEHIRKMKLGDAVKNEALESDFENVVSLKQFKTGTNN